jgi:hypothetical protein
VGITARAERDKLRHARIAHEARIDAASCRQDADSERRIYLGMANNHYHGRGRPRRDSECTNATHRENEHQLLRDAAELDITAEKHERLAAQCEVTASQIVPTGCWFCGGKGEYVGNGSALIGGSGKTRNQYGVAT